MEWNQSEIATLKQAMTEQAWVRTGLQKFLEHRARQCDRHMRTAMTSIPRRTDEAADYAVKSQVYEGLLKELDEALDKV